MINSVCFLRSAILTMYFKSSYACKLEPGLLFGVKGDAKNKLAHDFDRSRVLSTPVTPTHFRDQTKALNTIVTDTMT